MPRLLLSRLPILRDGSAYVSLTKGRLWVAYLRSVHWVAWPGIWRFRCADSAQGSECSFDVVERYAGTGRSAMVDRTWFPTAGKSL